MLSVTILPVTKPIKKNLQFPSEVAELFDQMSGKTKQWMLLSAAVMMFANANREEQVLYIGKVAQADATETFEELVRPMLERVKNAGRLQGRDNRLNQPPKSMGSRRG